MPIAASSRSFWSGPGAIRLPREQPAAATRWASAAFSVSPGGFPSLSSSIAWTVRSSSCTRRRASSRSWRIASSASESDSDVSTYEPTSALSTSARRRSTRHLRHGDLDAPQVLVAAVARPQSRSRERGAAEHLLDGTPGPGLYRLVAPQRHALVPRGELGHGARHQRADRLEHAVAAERHGFELGHAALVERERELLDRGDLGQVALVVLEHDRQRLGVAPDRLQVLAHLHVARAVLLETIGRRVRDEHDRVRPAHHEPSRRGVRRLPGNGHQLEADVEAVEADAAQREQVEQDRALLLGVHRDELAAVAGDRGGVQHLQVRGLSADGGAVVDELQLDDAVTRPELHARCPFLWAPVARARPGECRQYTRSAPRGAAVERGFETRKPLRRRIAAGASGTEVRSTSACGDDAAKRSRSDRCRAAAAFPARGPG